MRGRLGVMVRMILEGDSAATPVKDGVLAFGKKKILVLGQAGNSGITSDLNTPCPICRRAYPAASANVSPWHDGKVPSPY